MTIGNIEIGCHWLERGVLPDASNLPSPGSQIFQWNLDDGDSHVSGTGPYWCLGLQIGLLNFRT